MATIIIAGVIILIIVILFERINKVFSLTRVIVVSIVGVIATLFVLGYDYDDQYYDQEVWSGIVVDWEHKPEWEEKIPETCFDGVCTGGDTQYHPPENYIKTTDGGWIAVTQSPDGKHNFNEEWPNKTEQLEQYWPLGTYSASLHDYESNREAIYATIRNTEINEEDYTNLPEYPNQVTNKINIDRIVGHVPNKEEALHSLTKVNSEWSEYAPDPQDSKLIKPGENQANLVFVNLGPDLTEDYGLALQNAWKNGKKNDFIVSFSMNEDGKLNWVYPFSWSEVETLKSAVQAEMMAMGTIRDFVPVVEQVSQLVADQYVQKDLSDFDNMSITYIPSWTGFFKFCLCIVGLLLFQALYIRIQKG